MAAMAVDFDALAMDTDDAGRHEVAPIYTQNKIKHLSAGSKELRESKG